MIDLRNENLQLINDLQSRDSTVKKQKETISKMKNEI